MGICFGALAGLILMFVTQYEREDFFNDFTYWRQHDGLKEGGEAIINEGKSAIKGRHGYL